MVRVFRHEDIRKVGSGNIGATNVWRTYGRWLGIPVILLDISKGFATALVATLAVSHIARHLAGGAAMIGHERPLFLRFAKGGKMVATTAGVLFGLTPLVGLTCLGIWIVVFLLSRYASLASLAAAVGMPVFSFVYGEPWSVRLFVSVAAALVVVLHRANLKRLRKGTESRFHFRRAPELYQR